MEAQPRSEYRELPPPPALAPYVACLWVHRIGDVDGTYAQPVLPDGCVELVAFGDEVLVAGPATRSITLQLAPGTLTVGIRFRVGTAPALIGVSAAELRDMGPSLDTVWGPPGSTFLQRILEETDDRRRLAAMVAQLTDRVAGAGTIDPVGVGITRLLADYPRRPLATMADEVGLSERQLRRRVEDAVGYPPRTLARILRFQRFLHAARAAGVGRHLAALAADSGYADQAHLTRESRELTGLPPAALLDWTAETLKTRAPARPIRRGFQRRR